MSSIEINLPTMKENPTNMWFSALTHVAINVRDTKVVVFYN